MIDALVNAWFYAALSAAFLVWICVMVSTMKNDL